MLLTQHLPHFEQLRALGAFRERMLVLGHQENRTAISAPDIYGVTVFESLDPDGGDHRDDLTGDLTHLHGRFASVFNLGTVEHVWDAHAAWCNVARLIALDGFYVGHSPVGGWEGHGIHVTEAAFILRFLEMNGFRIVANWYALQDGTRIPMPRRGAGNQVLWMAAVKTFNVSEFLAPQQRFLNGKPC